MCLIFCFILFCSFTSVSKEVFTQVIPGIVVDFRPPLFCVSWSDGQEQLFVKKELDYFRRIHEKHIGLAEKRRSARGEKILKAAKVNGTSSALSEKNGELMGVDRSVLEWRLLELVAAHNVDTTMPAEDGNEIVNNEDEEQIQKPKSGGLNKKKKEGERGIIHVRNCGRLAVGEEPATDMWLAGRASVHELYLVHCNMSRAPPAGIMALSGLEVVDLSSNQLVLADPPPLPDTAPEWAREGTLGHLMKLSLRSNLLGSQSNGLLGNDALAWCKHLTHLDISNNPHLLAIPSSVSSMAKLEVLNAGHCSLDRVSRGVWSCTALTLLQLSVYRLTVYSHLFESC